MDPEKVKQWMTTEAGKAFHAELIAEGVAKEIKAQVEAGKLFSAESVEAMVSKARDEQKIASENERILSAAVDDIHALNPEEPKSAIRDKIAKFEAGAARDNKIEALKAEAKLFSLRNAPAPDKDSKRPGNVKERFDAMCDKGAFGEIRDDKHRAELFEQFRAQNR